MLVEYCTNVSINKHHVILAHLVSGHDYINCSQIHNIGVSKGFEAKRENR